MRRIPVFLVIVLVTCGMYAAWLYLQIVAGGCVSSCAQVYREVIAGTALSPYRYRVLSFLFVDLLGGNPQLDGAISMAFLAGYVLLFPAAFVAYYAALRRWLQPLGALLGVFVLLALLPVMMRVWGTSLYLVIELFLFSLALRWMRPGWQYAVLVLIAALNRETGVLLVLAYGAVHLSQWREKRVMFWGLSYALIWAAVFVLLRVGRGAAPDEVTLAAAWSGNTQTWHGIDALTYNLFFIPLYVSVFLSWRWLRLEVKRLFVLVALPYLILVAVFGFWNEVRLLIPVLPFMTVALVVVVERWTAGLTRSVLVND